MATPRRFVHLRLHTEYSLLEGAVRLKTLPDLVARSGMPAVAVTETNNMFSALEAATGLAAKGVQPIMGCQVSVMHDPWQPGEKPRRPAPVVLLAKDETGYGNLMRLNTCLYMARPDLEPQVTFEDLARHGDGLICLTGGPDGAVGRLVAQGREERAAAVLGRLARTFGDRLYVELQRHRPVGDQEPTERFHVERAYDMGLPLVATNDVYFAERLDARPPTTRSCASPRAPMSTRTPLAGGSRRSTTSRRPRRWQRSSPTCPRRWTAPSRSPGAAPSPPMAATRSCPASRRTRWPSCAVRPRRACARVSPSSPTPSRSPSTRRGSTTSWGSSRGWGSRATS